RKALTRALRAQTRNPCAVSRKYTSSECTSTQRVRSRPATYPPTPYAMICVTIIQMMAAMPKVAADAPSPAHGDIETNPSPAPPASNVRETAAAITAPAMTAAHDTAELEASYDLGRVETVEVTVPGCSMICP